MKLGKKETLFSSERQFDIKQKGRLSKTFQKSFLFSEDVFVIEIPRLLPWLCTSQVRKMELVVGSESESWIQGVIKVEHVLQFSVWNDEKDRKINTHSLKTELYCTLDHIPPKRSLVFSVWQSPMDIRIRLQWATQKSFHSFFCPSHTEFSVSCRALIGIWSDFWSTFHNWVNVFFARHSPAEKIQVRNAPWEINIPWLFFPWLIQSKASSQWKMSLACVTWVRTRWSLGPFQPKLF